MNIVRSCIIILISMCTVNFAANLKDYIPIVKPVIHDSTAKTLNEIATYLDSRGYKDAGDVFRSYAEGGHGSGFVVKNSDGSTFIITNKHVVKHGIKAEVIFKNSKNVKTSYEDTEILYVDDEYDLAVLDLKATSAKGLKSLKLTSAELEDGQKVWSVGYPGLLGQPGWQFAEGNVTNSKAYVNEIMDTSLSHLIQHSALIDPGNSGGPLLIKLSKAKSTEYAIAGVNTWLIRGRNNTFFAIPSSKVREVIKRAKRVKTEKSGSDNQFNKLEESCRVLTKELNSEEPDYSRTKNFISYNFVGTKGWDSYLYIHQRLSSSEKETWNTFFFNISPIETMRMAIYLRLERMISYDSTEISFNEINQSDRNADSSPTRTTFTMGKDKIELSWVYEFGHWRINDIDFTKHKRPTFRVIKPANTVNDKK